MRGIWSVLERLSNGKGETLNIEARYNIYLKVLNSASTPSAVRRRIEFSQGDCFQLTTVRSTHGTEYGVATVGKMDGVLAVKSVRVKL